MTETRGPDYRTITDHLYKLGQLVNAEMGRLDHMTDDRWAELHDISKILDAARCTLRRIEDREADAARWVQEVAAQLAAETIPAPGSPSLYQLREQLGSDPFGENFDSEERF